MEIILEFHDHIGIEKFKKIDFPLIIGDFVQDKSFILYKVFKRKYDVSTNTLIIKCKKDN